MAETNQTTDVAVIERALPTLKDLPNVLRGHQASVSGAISAAAALTEKCNQAGKMTPELDEECKALIIKLNSTKTKLEENRKPGTQIMTEIQKMFTGEEGKLVAPISSLQVFRDRRAREVVEYNREQERLAAQRAAKEKEVADCTAYFIKQIGMCLNKRLFERRQELNAGFDSFSLADIDERGEKLKAANMAFPEGRLLVILNYPQPVAGTDFKILTNPEIDGIEVKVKQEYNFQAFYDTYLQELNELRQALVDRLPSKLAELEEKERARQRQIQLEKEQEQQRLQAEQLRRDQAAAKTVADQEHVAQRQRVQAEQQKILDAQKLQQEQERKRLQDEEDERKSRQAAKDEEDRLAREEQSRQEAELAKVRMQGATLFTQAQSADLKQVEGETRRGWKMTVTHMAGWAEVWQQWFLDKAAATPLDKFGDLTLDRMKAYCEGIADTTKIKSPYIQYEETIKAVNRKERASKKPVV